MKHLLIILAIFLSSCAVDTGGGEGNGQGGDPPEPTVPTSPYITCIEVYDLEQQCDSLAELDFQEGYTMLTLHAGEFIQGSQYIRTRVDILNPLEAETFVWAEIVYDDDCSYGTLTPEVLYPKGAVTLFPGDKVTIGTDQVACSGMNLGERIITVKLWDEWGQPLETIIIGFNLVN